MFCEALNVVKDTYTLKQYYRVKFGKQHIV